MYTHIAMCIYIERERCIYIYTYMCRTCPAVPMPVEKVVKLAAFMPTLCYVILCYVVL